MLMRPDEYVLLLDPYAMFDMLKSLFGRTVKLRNPHAIDEAQLEALAEDFAHLRPIDDDLPPRVMKYVVDGDDPTVLDAIRSDGTASALRLRVTDLEPWKAQPRPRDELFKYKQRPPAEFWLRLARVWNAAKKGMSAPPVRLHTGTKSGCLTWPPELPDWFVTFLLEATLFSYTDRHIHPHCFSAELLERVLELDGRSAELVYRLVFLIPPNSITAHGIAQRIVQLADFGARASLVPEIILEGLSRADQEHRASILDILAKAGVRIGPLVEPIVKLAACPTRRIRTRALPLLHTDLEQAVPFLRQIAADGTAEERLHAIEALQRLDPKRSRAFFEERRHTEKSAKVMDIIENFLVISTPPVDDGRRPGRPPIPPVERVAPLPPETRDALRKLFDECNEAAHEYCERHRRHPGGHLPTTSSIGRKEADLAFELLQNLRVDEVNLVEVAPLRFLWNQTRAMIDEFLKRPEIRLIHAVRFLLLTGDCFQWAGEKEWWFAHDFNAHLRVHRDAHGHYGLRELAAVLDAIGISPKTIGCQMIESRGDLFDTDPEQVVGYLAEHVDILEGVFGLRPPYFEISTYSAGLYRERALLILTMFPEPPPSLESVLWEIALEGLKTERPLARRCLENAPNRDERLIKALTSNKWDTRVVAAEWLGDLRIPAAVEPLKKALRKEKHDSAKAAIIDALEALGASLDEFLDRDELLTQSTKILAKGIPAELAWFPFKSLPDVRWADNAESVAPRILSALIVQSCQLKSPEPGAMLRRYVSFFRPEDAEAFGQFVLDAWLSQDTLPITAEQAEDKARTDAPGIARYLQRPLAEVYAELLRAYLNVPTGSAIKSKGVLAIAAAACSAAAAHPVEQYLRTWFGHRAPQCKALIAMLSWIDDPAAIQLLLSISNRFRTPGIRKEAEKYVAQVAERKRWTLNELADRTIPTCGFDENRELTLDYGQRRFTARLDEKLNLVLTDADGRHLKALPAPRKSEDQDQVKAAKKVLSSARKELKTVLRLQRERLHEAMCTQRTWRFEDWNTYLNHHPIVRRYCQRLVWGVIDGNVIRQTFRPLDDGSLTDVADAAVTIDADATIVVAHESQVRADESQRWLAHLSDYEVTPLFAQFGRPTFVLDAQRREATAIEDFLGHMIDAFTLRNQAGKLGYSRGPAEDAGCYRIYSKAFPSLAIEAIIEFSGNYVGEQNVPVALMTMTFCRMRQESDEASIFRRFDEIGELQLAAVPPILLNECWNDLNTIASAGKGFDPEWEKKVN